VRGNARKVGCKVYKINAKTQTFPFSSNILAGNGLATRVKEYCIGQKIGNGRKLWPRKELKMDKVFEVIKHLLSMSAGWVVLAIILLAFILLVIGLCKSAAMADQMARELLCQISANKKKKSVKHLQSNEKKAEADREKDLVQWKKHRCLRKRPIIIIDDPVREDADMPTPEAIKDWYKKIGAMKM
jgi:hypothetical protein